MTGGGANFDQRKHWDIEIASGSTHTITETIPSSDVAVSTSCESTIELV